MTKQELINLQDLNLAGTPPITAEKHREAHESLINEMFTETLFFGTGLPNVEVNPYPAVAVLNWNLKLKKIGNNCSFYLSLQPINDWYETGGYDFTTQNFLILFINDDKLKPKTDYFQSDYFSEVLFVGEGHPFEGAVAFGLKDYILTQNSTNAIIISGTYQTIE